MAKSMHYIYCLQLFNLLTISHFKILAKVTKFRRKKATKKQKMTTGLLQ